MKIAIIGAGGVRTPLIVGALIRRAGRLGLTDLALMDIDGERLALIAALTTAVQGQAPFRITHTTDPHTALTDADFVITTFRVGGIAARIVDEQVPLRYGVLGQETTGPGGFAMALRSIPVLLGYLEVMRTACPHAWLINFANPAGLLAEAAIRHGHWPRTVGICDAPEGMRRVAAAVLGAEPDEVFLDYFGLNHLGWVRGVLHHSRDHLPELIAMIQAVGGLPGLPFAADLIASLGLIPNEYLFYYYHSVEAVRNLLAAGQTRGEQIAALNEALFARLSALQAAGDRDGMAAAYRAYLDDRGGTYMRGETGVGHQASGAPPELLKALAGEGYAGVALNLIEGLSGSRPRQMILNVPNAGAIAGMNPGDVVEVPAFVGPDGVRPLAVGQIPPACLGLMLQVKAYEQTTIAAATTGSYALAVQALTIHPLVRDYALARKIVDDYRALHGSLLPEVS